MPLPAGTRLGPYEILAAIGAGGMGEVYRARDPRLARDVAIKVLPEHLSQDPQALARFDREARTVAALSHPNILAVFDVGTEQGVGYVVTELLEGESLRSRVAHGALPWRKAVEMGAALAEGLAAAHIKGIVHRDIKPDNIFLTTEGRVKILDFGLARFRRPETDSDETVALTYTPEGTVMGTVGYMSPEQVRCAEVGPGSDIFSFGCVLYEMIAGRRAFRGPTSAETLSAILRDTPADLSVSGVRIPPELERLISHCLEKSPEERFQSARDIAFGLRAMLTGAPAPAPAPPAPSAPGKAIDSIAVLPFANASREPDAEYLSDGITESIINSVAQIAQLRVTPRSTVFRYKGKDLDPQAIGRELKVRAVLTGRVLQRGETLVVGAELVDVVEGSQLWGERYNRKLADIFELEEEIARKISESLRMKLTGEDKQRLAKRFTEDSEAYRLYLKGRHYWLRRTPGNLEKAIAHFQQAIEKDAGYALAYSGLADCYCILTIYNALPQKQGWAKAKAAAAAAVALDPELAEGQTSLAVLRWLVDWDWAGAEKGLRRAIELNPAYWTAPYWYAIILTGAGRLQEAQPQVQRALELEPLSPIVAHMAAWSSFAFRRYGEVIERAARGLEIDPQYPLLRLWLGMAYEQLSRYRDAIPELETALRLLGASPLAMGALGHVHALMGNRTEANRLLHELAELTERGLGDPYKEALIHAGLGEREQAFEWLDKAAGSRSAWLTIMIKNDARMDPLRPDPRFQNILRQMGLAQ